MLKHYTLKPLSIVCSLISFISPTYAQVNLSVTDIKKILIINSVGGMRGTSSLTIEVKPENKQWNSYQTSDYQRVYGSVSNIKPTAFTPVKIAMVPNDIMANFINGLSTIKTKFDPHTFGVTPAMLKAPLQVKKPLLPNEPDFDTSITAETIATAINKVFQRGTDITDYGVGIMINIITLKGDTVKMATGNCGITLLPWLLNKQETFDMTITHFFEASMGNKSFGGKYDPIEVTWYALGDTYPKLLHYRWQYGYPNNMALLKRDYEIKALDMRAAAPPPFLSQEIIYCTVVPKDSGFGVMLSSEADISNLTWLKKLNKLKNTVARLKLIDSFFFNYYHTIPNAEIIVSMPGEIAGLGGMTLYNQIPEAEDYYLTQYMSVSVRTPCGTSGWAMMPDGRLIMTYMSKDSKPQALPPQLQKTINPDDFGSYRKYALISTKGKRLR